jgi:hypothetical protein
MRLTGRFALPSGSISEHAQPPCLREPRREAPYPLGVGERTMRWVCRWMHRFLPEVAEGIALPPIAWWVRRHVARCPACARLWRQHERLTLWLQQAATERATPPSDLWARIAERMAPRERLAPQPSKGSVWGVTHRSWQKAVAAAALGVILLGAWLWWRSLPSPSPSVVTVASPDAFTIAVLHQHVAVTASSPFNNLTFTAGMIAGGEGQ